MPHIDTFTTNQSVVIAVWQLTETLSQLLEQWGDTPLPLNFTEITSERRQCEILATRLLLRHHYGRDIELHHHPNGAPYIDTENISISHCKSHIAIAMHPSRQVGIDIETLGQRAVRTATRFLSSMEYAALPDETTLIEGIEARTATLHIAWSVKEAVFKIYPTAVEFRRDIILPSLMSIPTGTIEVDLPTLNTTTTAHYTLYDGCSLAWALLNI